MTGSDDCLRPACVKCIMPIPVDGKAEICFAVMFGYVGVLVGWCIVIVFYDLSRGGHLFGSQPIANGLSLMIAVVVLLPLCAIGSIGGWAAGELSHGQFLLAAGSIVGPWAVFASLLFLARSRQIKRQAHTPCPSCGRCPV